MSSRVDFYLRTCAAVLLTIAAATTLEAQQAPVEKAGGRIDLPTSKQINGIVPGGPQQLGSLAVSMAASPDGHYVVTVNGGYGSFESGYMESLSVMDTATGKLVEFPDSRTLLQSKQVLFSGLAFSPDGARLYGSLVSGQDPLGTQVGDSGSGIQVYNFDHGRITPERVLKIGLEPLAPGHTTLLVGGGGRGAQPFSDGTKGLPYPAAIATVGADKLLVADNLSDCVLLMNASTGEILKRFDVSESAAIPGVYPVAVAVSRDGKRGFAGLWNASEVVELDLVTGGVGRKLQLLRNEDPVRPGSHPSALVMAPDGHTLYAALGNRDSVAAIDLGERAGADKFALRGFFDARLPGQSFYGAEPEALAVSADGSRLYAADMGSDAIAVFDTHKLTREAVRKGMVEPRGFIPTEWLPMALTYTGGKVYIATGKGTGTGPNNFAQRPTTATGSKGRFSQPFSYIATLLHGSLAAVDAKTAETHLSLLTEETLADNRMKAAEEKIAFAGGASPIKHVIYIIRENRTYDQILGDLNVNGKRVGNGDPKLVMYGADITPNMHKLVKQFGVLDNFYDSAEVSGDGHVWSNTAIGTDYLERTWQLNYRGGQHGYDYEGVVSQGVPLNQGIPDVNEPASGYIWGNVERHGLTHYNFGEYIATEFCNDRSKGSSRQDDPTRGPLLEGKACAARTEVKPGEMLPAVWGGGMNRWAWSIPLIATNTPTKPELVGHYAPESPDFNLRVPDEIRAQVMLKHLDGWIADKKAGKDTMPNFIEMRLGNDHTAGTTPGGPTPKASVADNDLAVGRIVEGISNSPFWDDTAIFVLEDDAQNGADHVDAHRSLGVVISKYAPHTPDGMPFVDSRFYSTVSMIRTMETVLGLPPMNNNDALCSMISTLFTGPGDQAPFRADRSNEANNLVFTVNPGNARGGRESAMMDFTHPDRADSTKLNVILWQDARGDAPVPPMLLVKRKKAMKDDDDE